MAWRYRNWVIEALHQDLPYDEFVRKQIAGDLLPAKKEELDFTPAQASKGAPRQAHNPAKRDHRFKSCPRTQFMTRSA
jgi:hypothetical protein